MKAKLFFLILSAITLFGFLIRVHDYTQAPHWNESLDEIHYAWTGMTWIKEGVPKSWSWLSSYPTSQIINLWNTDFRIVSPMLEKPPLYSLLSGIIVLLAGEDELSKVNIATIRLLPLLLSVCTIFLTGLLGKKVFSPTVGLLAALLYAVTPPIVLANRLSVTENLLTPLFMGIQLLFLYFIEIINVSLPFIKGEVRRGSNKFPLPPSLLKRGNFMAILIGLLSGLAALTKQSGLTAILASSGLFVYLKKWKYAVISAGIGLVILGIHPLAGLHYDAELFQTLQVELRRVGLQGGLPQLIQTIIARPLITTEKLYPDGIMLLGYFLFFTSPWFIKSLISSSKVIMASEARPGSVTKNTDSGQARMTFLLAFPFVYLVYLILVITGAEPIGSGQAYWGWYSFPFFPYLMILVAVLLQNLWDEWGLFKGIIIGGIVGSSMIRYLLLFFPREWHHRWQYGLMGIFIFVLISSLLRRVYRNRILVVLFILLIGVSVYTSAHLSRIY